MNYHFSLINKMSMKRRRRTAAESDRLLKDFYEKLDNESFLGNDFFGKDDPVGEPDSSSDENSKDENIESREETEECVQPEKGSIDTHEVAEQPQFPRNQIFKNLNEVLNESNYEELPEQKICLQS